MIKSAKIIIIFLLPIFLLSCNNNQEMIEKLKKELDNSESIKINSESDILICNPVYITKDGNVLSNTDFLYGEKFEIHFDNMEGFNNVDGKIYPELSLYILDSLKDTIFVAENLYNGKSYLYQKISLSSYIKCGDPMHSNHTYTAFINIKDNKGKGTYKCNFNFNIKPNNKIINKSNGISYNEIYLYSKNKAKAIVDNKISLNDDCYLIFEGLKGFNEKNDGFANIGMKSYVIDAKGDTLLNIKDLFTDEPYNANDIYDQCRYKFNISNTEFAQPLKYTVIIWDKNSDKFIESKYDISIQN